MVKGFENLNPFAVKLKNGFAFLKRRLHLMICVNYRETGSKLSKAKEKDNTAFGSMTNGVSVSSGPTMQMVLKMLKL